MKPPKSSVSKNDLKSLLFELKAQGKTIIMVSHDLDFVGDIADNVSFLSDGIISKAGGRREVFSSLNFYTTQIRRITKRYLAFAVSYEKALSRFDFCRFNIYSFVAAFFQQYKLLFGLRCGFNNFYAPFFLLV